MEKLVEIVEFYPAPPKQKSKLIGTLHVYLVINGLEIDLRGLRCYRVKRNIYIFIPDFKAIDDGEPVRYPMFNLTNHDLHKEVMDEIISKGREYIAQKMKEAPNGKVYERKYNHSRPHSQRSDYGAVRERAGQKPRAGNVSYVHPRDFSVLDKRGGETS